MAHASLQVFAAATARAEMPKNFDINSEERLYAWYSPLLMPEIMVLLSNVSGTSCAGHSNGAHN